MSIFNRLKTIFNANANAALDAAEDPSVMEAQAVRDLESKLQQGVDAEVQLKTLVVEKQTLANKKQKEADEWGVKANRLLDQVASGALTQEDADKYAGEALVEQQNAQHEADTAKADAETQQARLTSLEEKVKSLKTDIETLKAKLADVKSRETSAKATLDINKQLSTFGGDDNAHDLINRMEEKVAHIENQATAYDNLQNENKTDKQKIEEVLAKAAKPSASDALAALKATREAKNK